MFLQLVSCRSDACGQQREATMGAGGPDAVQTARCKRCGRGMGASRLSIGGYATWDGGSRAEKTKIGRNRLVGGRGGLVVCKGEGDG